MIAQIERVQKTALRIILGDNYITNNVACSLLDVETLENRREILCLNFARKEFKKEENSTIHLTLELNSLPYLTQLLNNSK